MNFATTEKARKSQRQILLVGIRKNNKFCRLKQDTRQETPRTTKIVFIKIRRTLRVVTLVQVQLLPSSSRKFGGLLGRSATLPDCPEDSSLTRFENPKGSWERQ